MFKPINAFIIAGTLFVAGCGSKSQNYVPKADLVASVDPNIDNSAMVVGYLDNGTSPLANTFVSNGEDFTFGGYAVNVEEFGLCPLVNSTKDMYKGETFVDLTRCVNGGAERGH